MWPLSIDEGPGQDQTKPADPAEELTTPDEEDTKPDQAEVEMANTAISVKFRATDRKNAGKG